jgi:2-polyprenyl-6-methoxyphenol hydroxylase-like FAD-dependent oxidoreductase
VGIANPDGTATLLLMTRRDQRENRPLASRAEVEGFLRDRNPALWKLVPNLEEILLERRQGGFVTTSSAGWVSERLVLLGDAAHAQPAYVGQGVNSALADCAAVTECLDRFKGDVTAALRDYEARRAAHSRFLKQFCHRHGQMFFGGSFGNWRWRWADWIKRLAERVFGRRTLYQRIVFDCE